MNQNDMLKTASGNIKIRDDFLTSFLYELMRDHVPVGTVEMVLRETMVDSTVTYSNGWLAQYANYVANRLRGENVLPVLNTEFGQADIMRGMPEQC